MCYVNKTATFKKIFEPIESTGAIAYATLSEDTIAHKIYKLRMLQGFTQRQFAQMCNIGYSSLCRYEIGYKPNLKNLRKICESLNIHINYFLKQKA